MCLFSKKNFCVSPLSTKRYTHQSVECERADALFCESPSQNH